MTTKHIQTGALPGHALIYCRVSSTRQKTEGHGLDSQEYRCRQYAELKGYTVDAVFPDDASGGGDFMNRPGMVALLSFLDAQPGKRFVVVFDDLKRFARDREFHFKLREAFALRGARVECLNYTFDDSPEGEFVEAVFAAQSQLERMQNRRQVIQKMQARLENGYFVFGPPFGYRYASVPGHGKMLVPDEVEAPLAREALEGFASGRFQTMTEVQRFLHSHPETQRGCRKLSSFQSIVDMLKRPTYAGYITVEKWDIHMKPGKHEPLISFETFQRIQARLEGKATAPARKDLNADFPLRGFVSCACCGQPMTAAWSKGRSAHYAYYFCQTKGCAERRKNIRKEKIEGEFETLLKQLKPSPDLFHIARRMMEDCWEVFRNAAETTAQHAKAELAALEKKTDQLMERIVSADSDTLIDAYEKQIRKLEMRKVELTEKASQKAKPLATFDQLYRTACMFLSNPWKLWNSDSLDLKRLTLRLTFPERISYDRSAGYRTAGIARPFRVLQALSSGNSRMVEPGGIEPPTS